jgi:hypothetical protein
MANFFKGLAGGFQTGLQFSDAMRRRQEYEEQQAEREQLRGIFTGQPTVTPGTAATPEQIRSAGLETGRMQMQDIADFGLSAQEAARYAPQMPSEAATTTPTMYSYGGLTRQTPFTPAELDRSRMEQAARVIAVRDPVRAAQLMQGIRREDIVAAQEERAARLFPGQLQAQEQALKTGALGLAAALRTDAKNRAFDTGWAELNQQTFETPEARANAFVDLVARTQGPVAAENLRASMTTNQINDLTLQTSRLTQGFNEAFRKGPDAVMKWVDEQNPDFTLKRDGNNLTITYADGRSEVESFESPAKLMSYFAAQASPTNFITYENNRLKRENEAERNRVLREAYGAKTPSARISDAEAALGRPLTPQERSTLLGLTPKAAVRDLTVPQQRAYEEAIKSDQWKMARSDAERIQILRNYRVPPELVGFEGMPSPRVGGAPGSETPSPATPQPGLTRPSGTQNLQSMVAGPERMPQAERLRRIQEEADMRGLARDEERAIRRAQVDERRAEVEKLGLTAAEVPTRVSPERARILRNSAYFELFPRDVQQALTEQSGMTQRSWENRSR